MVHFQFGRATSQVFMLFRKRHMNYQAVKEANYQVKTIKPHIFSRLLFHEDNNFQNIKNMTRTSYTNYISKDTVLLLTETS